MEATRSSCSESALDVYKPPEKMSKTFAKKVSKEGGKGYREKERARFGEAVFGKKFFKNAGFKPFVDSRKSFLGRVKNSKIIFGNDKIGFGKVFGKKERWIIGMLKKNYKGRCQKIKLKKSKDVVRTYSGIQAAYAQELEKEKEIKEFQCNVALTGLEIGEYTSDFVCVKENGDLRVRECVDRKYLMKPLTVKLLEASREYWRRNGVADWGMVINEEK